MEKTTLGRAGDPLLAFAFFLFNPLHPFVDMLRKDAVFDALPYFYRYAGWVSSFGF